MSGTLDIEANEFAQVATEATASIFSDDPYQLLARIAHGYHDVDLMRDELAKAGFSQVSITTLEKTAVRLRPMMRPMRIAKGLAAKRD